MHTFGSFFCVFAFHPISLGSLGLLFSSLASVVVVSLVHAGASKGEAFDDAVAEALESHRSKESQR